MRVAPIEKDTLFLRKTIYDLREEVDQLTMLQDMSKQILSNYNFDQIINTFFDIIKEFIGYNSCILYLYDEDSNAYQDVLAAFKLPKTTEDEKEQRTRAIQNAMKNAARVPLAVAYDALQVMDLAEKVIRNGNRNAVSDGAVGAMMARTAVLGALFNVKINLASVKDKAFVEETMRQANKLESRVHEREAEILSYVKI